MLIKLIAHGRDRFHIIDQQMILHTVHHLEAHVAQASLVDEA